MYVSLGSNCSVSWWLNKLELRKQAYPFDWLNITIKQLNIILNNKFDEYIDTLKIKCISDKHLDEFGNPSMIITNKYNIRYAHEVLSDDIDNFKLSLMTRIDRFYDLTKFNFIIYVRIELNILKSSYILELKELIKNLDSINPNYIIKLVIHKDSIKTLMIDNLDKKILSKIEIYCFDSFSSDWKMNHLDWKTILTSSK